MLWLIEEACFGAHTDTNAYPLCANRSVIDQEYILS